MIGGFLYFLIGRLLISRIPDTNGFLLAFSYVFLIISGFSLTSYWIDNGYLSIFKHLLCKHEYKYIGSKKLYGNYHQIYECTKCKKRK